MNIFKEIKEYLTALQAAEQYGIKINWNKMACCPFHDDHHPSMKIDQNYYCFACGAKGDVIDFTSRLFGISQFEAAQKLITDFGLPIRSEKKKHAPGKSQNRASSMVQSRYHFSVKNKILDWKNHAVKVLTDYLSWIRFWKKFYSSRQDPFEEEHFLEALSNEWKINAYLDILLAGSGEEIAQFFMDKRKEVADIEQRMDEYQRGVLEEIRKDCRG